MKCKDTSCTTKTRRQTIHLYSVLIQALAFIKRPLESDVVKSGWTEVLGVVYPCHKHTATSFASSTWGTHKSIRMRKTPKLPGSPVMVTKHHLDEMVQGGYHSLLSLTDEKKSQF